MEIVSNLLYYIIEKKKREAISEQATVNVLESFYKLK